MLACLACAIVFETGEWQAIYIVTNARHRQKKRQVLTRYLE